MDKGSSVERNEEFIRNAHEAGLSVRCTMFKGYPGETSDDLERTATFLEKQISFIDRIRFNEFSIPTGTPIYDSVMKTPELYGSIKVTGPASRYGRISYRNDGTGTHAYRKAKLRVLSMVHRINQRKIRSSARAFDGLM